jgi:glycosyltransferase involved in cell wall biosynthesis
MENGLTIGTWPAAVDCVMPRRGFHVGWLDAGDEQTLSSVVSLLNERLESELVCHAFVSDSDAEERPTPLGVTYCALTKGDLGVAIATLDVMVLSETQLAVWWDILRRWAIPPVVLTTKPGDGAHTIQVGPTDPFAIAGCCALLLTDPPSRRRSLDLLASWQPYMSFPLGPWRVEGVFDSSYSLALVNRQLALALERSTGGHAQLLTFEQGAAPAINTAGLLPATQHLVETLWQKTVDAKGAPLVALRNAWPPTVRGMRGHLRVLANYAWEETRFPTHFVSEFNETLDLITTVSTQTARFLEDAGVRVPIAVVGNGADHLENQPSAEPPHELPGGFRFLHVSSCFPRKAIDVILAAYAAVFTDKDDVVLIIKTFANPHNDIHEQVAQLRAARSDSPNVVIYDDDWTEAQVAGLYRICDAFIAPSRGEGFGLPLAEAMLAGLPVVASDWGGHRDFCSPDNSWLIPTKLVLASSHLSAPGSLWGEPDQTVLADTLLALHTEDAATRVDKLERAHTAAARFTWDAVARKTRHAVEQLSWQPAPSLAVRLGWLTTWRERCGIFEYSQHMTREMRPDGKQSFHVDLIVLAPLQDGPQDDDETFVVRCWQRASIKPLQQLIREVVAQQLDAVVIQYHWSFFSAEALVDTVRGLKGAGVAVFLDIHNTRDAPESITEDFNLRHGMACCDRVLVHTLADVAEAERWGLKDNLTLLPLAAYPIALPTAQSVLTRREAMGLSQKKVIATYGFLMAHKGCIELIDALPAVLAEHPDAHLLLVNAVYSEAVSAPVVSQIEARIEQLGLSEQVTCKFDFLPEEEIMLLLKIADLVVYPYQHSNESSSAAVRMAISGRCLTAITPLTIFADVEPGCIVLPGTAPSELAQGISDVLEQCDDENYRRQYLDDVERFAQDLSSEVLSRRLLGMVIGHHRRLEVH